MSSIDSLYWIFLTTGFLVGFGHCMGMCGPIVASLSLNRNQNGAVFPHFFYNSGRITTYGLLGGGMGMTGSFTMVVSHISVIQKGAMIFSGGLIVLMGLAMTGAIPCKQLFSDHGNPTGIISKGFRRLSISGRPAAYFPLGMLLGLLPCGPVYTALISAARTGMEAKTPVEGFFLGAGLMLCFGAGTVPALFLIARLTNVKWIKSRDRFYKISAVLMMGVGIYFVMKGIHY
jgi:uncharacterized protein